MDDQKDYEAILREVNGQIYNLSFDFLRRTYQLSGLDGRADGECAASSAAEGEPAGRRRTRAKSRPRESRLPRQAASPVGARRHPWGAGDWQAALLPDTGARDEAACGLRYVGESFCPVGAGAGTAAVADDATAGKPERAAGSRALGQAGEDSERVGAAATAGFSPSRGASSNDGVACAADGARVPGCVPLLPHADEGV